MSTELLIEKLTNLQTFMRENILVDMKIDDKRIKQILNEQVKKNLSEYATNLEKIDQKQSKAKSSDVLESKLLHQFSSSKIDFTKEMGIMDMSYIIQFLANMDIERELTHERLKELEMGVLKFIAPMIENDGQKLLRKLTLVAFHRLDPDYTVKDADIETIMKYFNFLYEYFQN